jgi:hypothetical protein
VEDPLRADHSHGTAFEGTDGWVHGDREGINAHPKELLDTQWGPNDNRLNESGNHARNLLDCVKSRKETICPIDAAVQADTLCRSATSRSAWSGSCDGIGRGNDSWTTTRPTAGSRERCGAPGGCKHR